VLAYRSRRVCGPKTERTGLDTEHIVRSYLIPRWEEEIADDIKSLDIQRWLKSLHNDDGLAWTTISKMRGTMLGVYKVGILHELVTRNPLAAGRNTLHDQLQGDSGYPAADSRYHREPA
jgi:hypothetical protein